MAAARPPSASSPETPGAARNRRRPAGAAVRTAYSTAFNNGVRRSSPAMRPRVDRPLSRSVEVLDQVTASPESLRHPETWWPGLPNPTCVANSTGYLFYGDLLHLTSNGFAIVGNMSRDNLPPADLAGSFGSSASIPRGNGDGRCRAGAISTAAAAERRAFASTWSAMPFRTMLRRLAR